MSDRIWSKAAEDQPHATEQDNQDVINATNFKVDKEF